MFFVLDIFLIMLGQNDIMMKLCLIIYFKNIINIKQSKNKLFFKHNYFGKK